MNDWVYVVTGHGETWVFDDENMAEEFAAIRGGCEYESCQVIGENDARAMIEQQVRERRDEDRMRRAGL